MNTDDLNPGENAFKTSNDQIAQKKLSDTRKPTISLKALNQLRKMRELRKLDKMRQADFVEIMYGAAAAEPGA